MSTPAVIIGSLILTWGLKHISVSIGALACAIDNQLQVKSEESQLKLIVDNTKGKL